jgi:hypothetical protein
VAGWIAASAAEPERFALAVVGGLAVVVLAIGLGAGWPSAIPIAVVLLGGAYALELAVAGGAIDRAAPALAAALLFVCELAYWSLEQRLPVRDEPGGVARRVAFLALLAAGTFALGSALLGVSEAGEGGGVPLEAVGALAAVATLFLAALLAQRRA